MERPKRLFLESTIAGIVLGVGGFFYSEFKERVPMPQYPNTIVGGIAAQMERNSMQIDQNVKYGVRGLLVGIAIPATLEGAHYLAKRKKSSSS